MTKREYKAMVARVRGLDRLYREGKPEVTDAEWDALLGELRAVEEAHPEWAAEDSPTRCVGDARTGAGAKVWHRVPMLSLTALEHDWEVYEWWRGLKKPAVTMEPKIDGIAVILHYVDDVLTCVSTRGNGHEGEDITEKVLHAAGILQKLPGWRGITGEFRGELYISKSGFRGMPRDCGEGRYATPRDAVAACINLEQADMWKDFALEFACYDCAGPVREQLTDAEALRDLCKELGIPCLMPPAIFEGKSQALFLACLHLMQQERSIWDIPTDGIVIKVKDFRRREELGTGYRSPKWAVSYKPHF